MKTSLPLCLFYALILQLSARGQCSSTSGPNGGAASAVSGGGLGWSNPSMVQAKDFSYSISSASFTLLGGSSNSKYLTLTNFGISVPASATICGIQIDVYGFATGLISLAGTVSDNSVKIIKNGVIGGAEMSTGAGWGGSYAATSYGGNGSLWGQTWTPADVNASNFGVAISVSFNALVAVSLTANIDYIQATVFYDNSTLGINLQDFSANLKDASGQLAWRVSTPGDLAKFTIERSGPSGEWHDLANINTSPSQRQYSYIDPSPLAGINEYRLHMVTNTGREGYSTIREIEFNAFPISVYPNPVASTLNICSLDIIHHVIVKDMTGKVLNIASPGGQARDMQIQVTALRPGIYLLEVDKRTIKWVKN